jgi:hypothetical protein
MPAVLANGLDYSAGRPRGAAITACGCSFVVRYIDHPSRMGGKHITPAEYADLTSHGVQVWLVAERTVDDWKGGHAAGAALARDARAGADRIGYPAGRLIFLTADMHLTAAQLPTVLAFIDGAASVLGWAATGGYGFSELIRALKAGNHCRGLWQTGSRSVLVPGAHIYQANDRPNITVEGVACDVNELLIQLEDTDMPLTQADADLVAKALVPYLQEITTGAGNSVDNNPLLQQLRDADDARFSAVTGRLDVIAAKLGGMAGGGGTPLDYGALAVALAPELAKHLQLRAV